MAEAFLERWFGFTERHTDLATEVRAGVTTFMVMAYIIFVNPNHRSRKRSEEHTSELQSQSNLVCRLLLEKKNRAQARSPTCRLPACRGCYRLSTHSSPGRSDARRPPPAARRRDTTSSARSARSSITCHS